MKTRARTRSLRLTEELDARVRQLPRGRFSSLVNRLLYLYWHDEVVEKHVNNVEKPEFDNSLPR